MKNFKICVQIIKNTLKRIKLNMNFLFKNEIIDYQYFDNKQEKTILFLHGWGGNKNSFINTTSLLKQRFNILTLTMPTIQPTVSVWNLNDYAELVCYLLSLINIEEISIVCHSFGFRVACLLKEKIKINKIVVTGGAGLKRNSVFSNIENQNRKIYLNKNKSFFNIMASADYKVLPHTNKQTFKNIVNFNLIDFCNFKCPMLIFWGKNDKDTRFWIAKYLYKHNNAKLISTNSDHFAYIKENAFFNNAVLKFLKWFIFFC